MAELLCGWRFRVVHLSLGYVGRRYMPSPEVCARLVRLIENEDGVEAPDRMFHIHPKKSHVEFTPKVVSVMYELDGHTDWAATEDQGINSELISHVDRVQSTLMLRLQREGIANRYSVHWVNLHARIQWPHRIPAVLRTLQQREGIDSVRVWETPCTRGNTAKWLGHANGAQVPVFEFDVGNHLVPVSFPSSGIVQCVTAANVKELVGVLPPSHIEDAPSAKKPRLRVPLMEHVFQSGTSCKDVERNTFRRQRCSQQAQFATACCCHQKPSSTAGCTVVAKLESCPPYFFLCVLARLDSWLHGCKKKTGQQQIQQAKTNIIYTTG